MPRFQYRRHRLRQAVGSYECSGRSPMHPSPPQPQKTASSAKCSAGPSTLTESEPRLVCLEGRVSARISYKDDFCRDNYQRSLERGASLHRLSEFLHPRICSGLIPKRWQRHRRLQRRQSKEGPGQVIPGRIRGGGRTKVGG